MRTGTDPPESVRAWAQSRLPTPILEASAVGGGITRTKWRLQTAAGPVVLRWSDPEAWGDIGREHVRREAQALSLLADSGLPVPRLLAVDLDGAAGGPALLATWLPGRTRLDPLPAPSLGRLAEVTVAIHRHPVPSGRRPTEVAYRGPAEPRIPSWARDPERWQQAFDLRAAGPPDTPYGLLHRDLHFGNLVWQHDVLTGVLDWAETSWGPPELDVAHLCSDLAMLGTGPAEDFRAAYRAAGGVLDPMAMRFWQVADILGFLPDPAHILPGLAHLRPELTADQVRARLEQLLVETLS